MKQPQPSPPRVKSTVSEAETRLSSDEKPKKQLANASRIAPEKYSKLTAVELDRLLWHQLLLNPQKYLDKKFLKPDAMREINFDPVEKRLPVPKMVNKKTESRRRLEVELEERNRPNVFTYSPDDRKIKTRAPLVTIPKGRRGDRTPSPDRRRPLNVSQKLTKRQPAEVTIAPEHSITERQIEREVEAMRLGPATYSANYQLVEPR